MYIYKLIFPTGDIYIGQTIHALNYRLNQHIRHLKNGSHHSPKAQNLFNKYKEVPSIELIETINPDINNLNDREVYWIQQYNSFNNGLNCTMGGNQMYGEDSPSAKYTKDDYTAIVTFFANTELSLEEISEELELPLSLVKNIGYGNTHNYLSSIVPEEYAKMLAKVGTRKTGIKNTFPDIRGPDGVVYKVTNLREFAKQHNIGKDNAGLSDLISGSVKSVKGYSLASTPVIRLKHEDGRVIEVPNAKDKREFRKQYDLGAEGLRYLLSGKQETHKGWRIYNEC